MQMENFCRVPNIFDQYILIHLKTINILDFLKDFEIVITVLIDIDKETDIKFEKLKQNNEILSFCVDDIEKLTHKMITDLRENFALSAVGYEISNK